MLVREIQSGDILKNCRNALNLPDSPEGLLDDMLIAALVRRAAGINCPCSRKALLKQVLMSLKGIDTGNDSLKEAIEDIIEKLIVIGDLLELKDVTIEDVNVRSTWIFSAPPSFVVRRNSTIFVLGVVKDYETLLPDSIKMNYSSIRRWVNANNHSPENLKELGLHEISEEIWLKCPDKQSAGDICHEYEEKLSSRGESGAIEGLRILDGSKPVKFYKGRWAAPQKQTGNYIARRPQQYGNDLWCFVNLQDGLPMKLLDLPGEDSNWRPCDVAWHIQMAIDYCEGASQIYRTTTIDNQVRFDFFSPIPLWAERRFMIFGDSIKAEKCLFSYMLPNEQAKIEEDFLISHLWMQKFNN